MSPHDVSWESLAKQGADRVAELERRIDNQKDTIVRLADALRTLLGSPAYQDPFFLIDDSNRAIKVMRLESQLRQEREAALNVAEKANEQIVYLRTTLKRYSDVDDYYRNKIIPEWAIMALANTEAFESLGDAPNAAGSVEQVTAEDIRSGAETVEVEGKPIEADEAGVGPRFSAQAKEAYVPIPDMLRKCAQCLWTFGEHESGSYACPTRKGFSSVYRFTKERLDR